MGRHVIVSGGGTGTGRAIAARFADAGDDVLVVGRREEVLAEAAAEINRAAGRAAVTHAQADLADPDSVERLEPSLPETVDVLVNNAGGLRGGGGETLRDVAAAFTAHFEANCLTAALLTELVRRRLRRGGRIVNTSSIAALRPGGGSYGAAKAALIAWTYSLAAELGPEGITANVVAPGYVTDTEFFGGGMTEERHRVLVEQTMTGRASTPEDVAAAVFFLASPEAAQITGQVLQVNGGALVGRG
jgi:3-oxoacyl-[acyl-carrier protein] reductase